MSLFFILVADKCAHIFLNVQPLFTEKLTNTTTCNCFHCKNHIINISICCNIKKIKYHIKWRYTIFKLVYIRKILFRDLIMAPWVGFGRPFIFTKILVFFFDNPIILQPESVVKYQSRQNFYHNLFTTILIKNFPTSKIVALENNQSKFRQFVLHFSDAYLLSERGINEINFENQQKFDLLIFFAPTDDTTNIPTHTQSGVHVQKGWGDIFYSSMLLVL